MKHALTKRCLNVWLAAITLTGALLVGGTIGHIDAAQASQIKIIVNKQAITSTDINRRMALLRLQRRSGDLRQLARQDLTDEALKRDEIIRVRASPSVTEVNQSFERFASNNNMTPKRLEAILAQQGVTSKHFKQFIAIQMGWNRVLSARYGQTGSGGMSTQDLVSKMLELGDNQPSTTEYILQQVIFVVPQSRRTKSFINTRNSEARKLRQQIQSCEATQDQTKGLRDVTVRNLGRFMKQELPRDWSALVTKTEINTPTKTRVTDKGVEFVIVCAARSVADDKAAEIVFRTEGERSPANAENTERYLSELRTRAVIIER